MINYFKRLTALILTSVMTFAAGCTSEELNGGCATDDYGCVMYFMDVGQADSCLIKCDGEYMMIDGGNNDDGDMLSDYLINNGIDSLKYVVATHPHEDHIGGLDDVLHDVGAEQVIIPKCDHSSTNGENLLKAIEYCGAETLYANAGDTYTIGSGSFEILGPLEISDNMNANSVIVRFDYDGVSALFTGDSERQEEEKMLDMGLISDIDILKVGHHGSREASSYRFLRTAMPEYAVISTGAGNSYGHPHEEAISRLEDCGAAIYRTDEVGEIIFSTDGKNIKVTTDDLETVSPAAEKVKAEDKVINEPDDNFYIGNINSKIFHKDSCGGLPKEENRVYFSSRAEAEKQNYKPCGNCNP